MKKSVFYVMVVLLALFSCTRNESDDLDDVFVDVSDILENISEEWGVTVPYQDVSNTKTYHLLKDLMVYLRENVFYYVCPTCSKIPGCTPSECDSILRINNKANELIKRNDCVTVLISTYLNLFKTIIDDIDNDYDGRDPLCWIKIGKIEVLYSALSSKMFMSIFSKTEKVQLMALVLEMIKYEGNFINRYAPYSIMISIMLSSDFPPFIENVKPMLIETGPFPCYELIMNNGYIWPGQDDQASDLIIDLSKQFIILNK